MPEPLMIAGASDSAIADWLEARLSAALASAAGMVSITVPGGSTPFPILAELTSRPLDWRRIAVWPGDERIVAEHDPASNVGRIRAALAGTAARIVPLAESSCRRISPSHGSAWAATGILPRCSPAAIRVPTIRGSCAA
jgi:6-phosphogluconolactonase